LNHVIKYSGFIILAENNSELSQSFLDFFENCENRNSHYTVAMITLNWNKGRHANVFIADNFTREIERFDPKGTLTTLTNREQIQMERKLDQMLSKLAQSYHYKYYPPADFCPSFGIQYEETEFKRGKGYCVLWSIVYAIERLTSNLSKEELAMNFLHHLISKYNLSYQSLEEWLLDFVGEIYQQNLDIINRIVFT
jgi:hypothetical protein